MSQEAFRLRRIIIIDSFWKGKVNEIDFDGHTQLEGTNGAGKTSLMRLLPLFYGMRPGDIVSKVDQAKNFVDYYLPRESSMLVYEYQRVGAYQHQVCCMLASSTTGRTIQYKLIDAPYQQEYFINQDHRPYKMAEIERNYGRNCFKSNYLNVARYRQVIQNLREGRTSSDVRDLQRRFAFSHHPMPHVDKVVNGTIEKNLDFDAVKKMLVAITADYLARGQADAKREPMQLNKDEIGSWLADIQASREVDGYGEKIARWQAEFNQLEQHVAELRHLLALLHTQQQELDQQQQQQDESIKLLRSKIKQLQADYQQQREQLQEQLMLAKDDLKAKQQECDRLDKEKATFDDDDAASYQLKADEQQRFSAELQAVEQIINALEGDVARIADKYRDLLHKTELELSQGEGEINAQQFKLREQAGKRLNEIEANYQQQRRQLEQTQDSRALELTKQLLVVQHQLKVNSESRAHPQPDPELEQAVQQSHQQLAEAQSQRNLQLQALAEIAKYSGDLERQRDQKLASRAAEHKRLLELQSQRETLSLQLNPIPGSLQQFLMEQEQTKAWKQHIGCLLSPQQLARTDLNPQWSGEGLNSLYGVQLDLTPLQRNNPLASSEAELQQQLSKLDQEIEQQQLENQQLDEQLKQKSSWISQQQQKQALAQQQEGRCASQIDQLQQQLERQQRLRDDSVKQKLAELDKDAQQLRKRISELEQQQAEQAEQAKQQQHELHNLSMEARADVETERDSQIDTLSEQLQTLQANCAERCKDYKRQQKQALEQIDPDGEIDRRHQQRKQLNAKLQHCAEFQQKAKAYDYFMQNQFSQREVLGQQQMALQLEVSQLETAQSKLKADFDSDYGRQDRELHKLKQKQVRTIDLLDHLKRTANSCEDLELEAALDAEQPVYQARDLPEFVKQNQQQLSHLRRGLDREISDFANTLRRKHGRSSLYESWLKLVADNDHYQGCESVLKYRAPIGDLLASAAQLKASTSLLIQTNAQMINEFYQHLENFDRRIKAVGRRLSERVTELAQFEAFAEISVGTVTKLDQLEYWSPLKSFSERYELSKDRLQDLNSDIPEELIEAMQSLARVLPAEGVQLEHNELFDLEFVITEKGQVKRARNARQLKKVSSTGLSYLAMLSLFAGLLAMLRGDSQYPSSIILPVDELGELAAENIKLLLKMFDDNAIQMLSASPATDRQVLALYKNHYKLKDSKIYQASVPISKLEQLMAARAAAQQTQEAPSHV